MLARADPFAVDLNLTRAALSLAALVVDERVGLGCDLAQGLSSARHRRLALRVEHHGDVTEELVARRDLRHLNLAGSHERGEVRLWLCDDAPRLHGLLSHLLVSLGGLEKIIQRSDGADSLRANRSLGARAVLGGLGPQAVPETLLLLRLLKWLLAWEAKSFRNLELLLPLRGTGCVPLLRSRGGCERRGKPHLARLLDALHVLPLGQQGRCERNNLKGGTRRLGLVG
mmetsp:Transcript_17873/g.33861  ORF Transcript_17873/g.33861 Transcript_17873/m.33861 type:complete len:228 (+) Transcript_17873:719-1402(+)